MPDEQLEEQGDVVKKKEFKAETFEQLANYTEERSKEDFRAEMRNEELPINTNNRSEDTLRLLQAIDKVSSNSDSARAIKRLMRMRIMNPLHWTLPRLSEYFGVPINTIAILEHQGKCMVKEAIARNKGKWI